MRRLIAGILGVLVSVGLALPVSAQESPATDVKLADIAIDHIGIVVRDLDPVVKAYAEVFGLPVPAVHEETGIPFPKGFKGDPKASVKTALFPLNGVTVELIQPLGGSSPWRDHLDTYGEGMHHIAYHGLKNAYARASKAIARGGKVTVGGPGATTVMVDLREKLGMTIGFSELPANPARLASAEAENYADNLVSYTSVIVPDITASLALFAEITGAAVPMVREAKISYPEGYTGEWTGYPALGMVALEGMSIAFTAPVGGKSPWRENVEKYGAALHHLGILIKGHPQQIAFLEGKGGSVVIGGGTMGYSWMDMSSTLKTLIEMNGK
jgi:catechol 2,3-dioxygenase-like lactoylglutathione lyase family enzyme